MSNKLWLQTFLDSVYFIVTASYKVNKFGQYQIAEVFRAPLLDLHNLSIRVLLNSCTSKQKYCLCLTIGIVIDAILMMYSCNIHIHFV